MLDFIWLVVHTHVRVEDVAGRDKTEHKVLNVKS